MCIAAHRGVDADPNPDFHIEEPTSIVALDESPRVVAGDSA